MEDDLISYKGEKLDKGKFSYYSEIKKKFIDGIDIKRNSKDSANKEENKQEREEVFNSKNFVTFNQADDKLRKNTINQPENNNEIHKRNQEVNSSNGKGDNKHLEEESKQSYNISEKINKYSNPNKSESLGKEQKIVLNDKNEQEFQNSGLRLGKFLNKTNENIRLKFLHKKSLNLSLGEVIRIFKIFKILCDGEKQVEIVRQVLSEVSQFDPFSTFKYLDNDNKNYLTRNDILRYLK